MQNFFIFNFFFLLTFIQEGLTSCQKNDFDSPTQLYPTLNSPSYLGLQDYIVGSSLTYSFEGILNATIYQTTVGPQLLYNIDGEVISSCEQQSNSNPSFTEYALLVQNKSGYYIYQLTVTNDGLNIYLLNQGIEVPQYIICYSILYQQDQILVSCVGQNNSLVIYVFSLINQINNINLHHFNSPIPFVVNYDLQMDSIINNFINILNDQNNSNQLVLGYSSLKNNESVVLYFQMIEDYQMITSKEYDSQLMGIEIIDQLGIQILLFYNQLLIIQNNQEYVYSYPEGLFLDFAIQYYSDIQIFISTDVNILIIYYNFNQHTFKLIDKVQYPLYFVTNIFEKLQIFVNNEFLVISNKYHLLTYQLKNTEHIFYSDSQNIQAVLFNQFNQTIIQISTNFVQVINLMIPKLLMYFDTLESGNFKIWAGQCQFDLNFTVILSNNTQPLPSFLSQNYLLNYPKESLWDIGNQFVGQNLTYQVQAHDANIRLSLINIKDYIFDCQSDPLKYVNIFKNPLNVNQYMIIIQCDYNIHISYCDFQFCDSKFVSLSSYWTESYILWETLNVFFDPITEQQLLQLTTVQENIENRYIFSFLTFNWLKSTPLTETILNYKSLIDGQEVSQILSTQFNIYCLTVNPSALFQIYNYELVSLEYFPRWIYVNNEDYQNLIFLDEIFQLSVYQTQPNQLGLIKIIDIQYPIQSGDTSVGIGLLQSGIFISQNDDQGNQFILYYPREILRKQYSSLIQPQQIQIPVGAIIQFPIFSSFTSNKFYISWIFNSQTELATLRPSNDINSVLFQSFVYEIEFYDYFSGAISIGNYDQLLMVASSVLDIYSVSNKIYVEIIPQNLLKNLTEKVQLQITANYFEQQQSSTIDFIVMNRIFDINVEAKQPINISIFDQNYFKLNPIDLYSGLIDNFTCYNNYKELNNLQQPITQFYSIIEVYPIPQAFYGLNNQLYFQNTQHLYRINNLYLGAYQVLASFDMVICPILYSINDTQIYSVCQDSGYYAVQLLYDTNTQQQIQLGEMFLASSSNIIGGGYLNLNLVYFYNDGQVYVTNFQNIYCQVFLYGIVVEGFLQDNQEQINYGSYFILSYYINYTYVEILVNCQDKAFIRFGPLVTSEITAMSFGFSNNQISQFKLAIITDKESVIYYINYINDVIEIVSYQLVNKNINMNGIGGQLYPNYLVVAYQTLPQNYSIILYGNNNNSQGISMLNQLPIISYFSEFLGEPINFFFTQDGQVIYTVDRGFGYIQIVPYIYVGINNKYLDLTYLSNNYDSITSQTMLDIVISNPFYNQTLKVNLTITNLQTIQIYEFYSQYELILILLITSSIALTFFFIFIGYKIYFAKNQFE